MTRQYRNDVYVTNILTSPVFKVFPVFLQIITLSNDDSGHIRVRWEFSGITKVFLYLNPLLFPTFQPAFAPSASGLHTPSHFSC